MNIHITPKSAAIAALITAGATAIALGPLNPPSGPVAETSPSLADLETKIDQVILGQSGSSELSAPFEIFKTPSTGNHSSNLSGTLIAEGRVYVESVTAMFSTATVFDGPGAIDTSGRTTTDNWISRVNQTRLQTGGPPNGVGQLTTTTVPIQAIVENGLHAAWFSQFDSGYVIIRYKRLP